VISAAKALATNPSLSEMPAAIAITFFSAPPSFAQLRGTLVLG
jgi:hypothetical protein